MDEYEQRYMEPNERLLFREKVVSRGAFAVAGIFLAVFGSVGLALIAAGAFGAMPLAGGLGAGAPLALLGVTMAVLGAMFSVFRSMVTTSHLHIHFGWAKRRIAHASIEAVRVIKLTGFKQGKVSIGLDGIVRTWVGHSASGRGVEVTYREPGARTHIITVGSERADEYVAELERAGARVRISADSAREHAAIADEDEAVRGARSEPEECSVEEAGGDSIGVKRGA